MNGIKKLARGWTPWEIGWLLAASGVALWITVADGDGFFGFTVFLSGILCVVLAAKGNIATYPVGMYNTLGYAWLSWQNRLFGEAGLNLLFFLPMNVIGFLLWRGHVDREEGAVRMRRMGLLGVALLAAASLAGIGLLGWGLSHIPGQNSPYVDAATNVLSVAATLLMVRRYREQWLCYIVLNILSVVMWSLRAAAGSPEGPLMTVMWSAYLLNACYGWRVWTRGAGKGAAV